MTREEYRKFVEGRLEGCSLNEARLFGAMNIAGEAGEVLDLWKKYFYGKCKLNDEFEDNLLLELGDVMFAIEVFCITEGFTLEEIRQANYEKVGLGSNHPPLHFRGTL